MLKPIGDDWLHWRGNGWHVGFHRHGNCWSLRFDRVRYATGTVYRFWRFFLWIDSNKVTT